MPEGLMQQCPPDSPLMKAWDAYRETEGFQNSFNWATRVKSYDHDRNAHDEVRRATDTQRGDWVKGALWAAFVEGFNMATERAAMLHESVRPTSDAERQDKVPGAGATGAVIEYRDLIRATK